MDLNISSKSDTIKEEIRYRYRDLVDAFIEEHQWLPEYRNYYDPTKVDLYHLLSDANRYGLFEVKSDFPEYNFSSERGMKNPTTFWAGVFAGQYYQKKEEHYRRNVIKKQYKESHQERRNQIT